MSRTTEAEWQLKKAGMRAAKTLGFQPKSWNLKEIVKALEEASSSFTTKANP